MHTPASAKAVKTVETAEAVDAMGTVGANREASALETELRERYVVKRAQLASETFAASATVYLLRPDGSKIAFTESTFKLATGTSDPQVVRSMVAVAQARHWKGLRVAGSEDFRRLVWLEASLRGVKTAGYEPSLADLGALQHKREQELDRMREHLRAGNHTLHHTDRHTEHSTGETVRTSPPLQPAAPGPNERPPPRGTRAHEAVLAAIEAILVAKGMPQPKRDAVLAAASAQLAHRAEAGQRMPRVKIYDLAAPRQHLSATSIRTPERSPLRRVPTPNR